MNIGGDIIPKLVGAGVAKVETQGGRVSHVVLNDGREVAAKAVVSNADPFRTRTLVGADRFPAAFNAKLDGFRRTDELDEPVAADDGTPGGRS